MAKMVEVDEAQYLAGQNVSAVVNQMLSNPEARKLVLRARKIADPKANIPEIDAAEPIMSEVEKLRKEMAEDKALRAKEKSEEDTKRKTDEFALAWAKQKQEVQAERGLNDDGIKSIEEHATKEGIPNFRAAANDWLALHPPAVPAQPVGFGSFNLFEPTEKEGNDMKALLETRGEAEGVLNSMIGKALGEARGRRAA